MFKPANRRPMRAAARSHTPRREVRQEMTRSATLRLNAEGSAAACTLRDLHTRGARVSVADVRTIPDIVRLECRSANLSTMAKVVWRQGYECGLSFYRG